MATLSHGRPNTSAAEYDPFAAVSCFLAGNNSSQNVRRVRKPPTVLFSDYGYIGRTAAMRSRAFFPSHCHSSESSPAPECSLPPRPRHDADKPQHVGIGNNRHHRVPTADVCLHINDMSSNINMMDITSRNDDTSSFGRFPSQSQTQYIQRSRRHRNEKPNRTASMSNKYYKLQKNFLVVLMRHMAGKRLRSDFIRRASPTIRLNQTTILLGGGRCLGAPKCCVHGNRAAFFDRPGHSPTGAHNKSSAAVNLRTAPNTATPSKGPNLRARSELGSSSVTKAEYGEDYQHVWSAAAGSKRKTRGGRVVVLQKTVNLMSRTAQSIALNKI